MTKAIPPPGTTAHDRVHDPQALLRPSLGPKDLVSPDSPCCRGRAVPGPGPARRLAVTREEFRARWSARCEELERLGAHVNGAKLCREVLADFEAVVTYEDEALLGLQDAAVRSGYSADHLRRLHRAGKLPARRDGRRLFFRAGDLPKKATVVDARPVRAYDPVADARRVATRTSSGGTDG
jgi:hypothetical protein